ncbi:MAG TPA: SIS domain-containing protein [Elusimicrobiales bacterium]|nr:SIS domain-containing protein [Elusimicrobiales bacterium]
MTLRPETQELLTVLKTLDRHNDDIKLFASKIAEAFKNGRKLILLGNGGSAADAQHIAAEFVGRYKRERAGLPALALNTNTSTITSVGNDYSFEDIFSRQIEAFAAPGDIVVALSTSGNSPNAVKAVRMAKTRSCYTVGLLGCGGGILRELVDLPIIIESNKTPRIQECHIHLAHIVCGMAEDLLA